MSDAALQEGGAASPRERAGEDHPGAAAADAVPEASPGTPVYEGAAAWLRFFAALFPASVYVGTQTVANAVLPEMQGDLSAGIDQISWVVTGAVIAGAIGIPPTGWLTARFGRRRLMTQAMLAFAFASSAVAFADSLGAVVFWRAVSAFCAAPVVALSQSVTLDVFPLERRGAAFSMWAIGILTGWIFAPVIGASVSELESWRLIFLALGPVGLLAALATRLVPDTPRRPGARFDHFGFVSLSIGLGTLLLVLNRGQRLDWLESQEIRWLLFAGLLALVVFALHTAMARHRLIDWHIFRDRNYGFGVIVVFVYAYLSLAPLVLLPTLLSRLKGLELLTTGLVLIPRGLAQIAGLLLIIPILPRVDPRVLTVVGFVMYAVSGFHMAGYNLDIGLADVIWPNVVQGVSMSIIWVPIANLVYSNLPMHLRTDATTVVSLLYSIASSVGVAVAVTILSRSTQVNQEELAARVTETTELLRYPEYARMWALDSVQGAAALAAEVRRQAAMIAYANAFYALSVFALAVAPVVLVLRPPRPAPGS